MEKINEREKQLQEKDKPAQCIKATDSSMVLQKRNKVFSH